MNAQEFKKLKEGDKVVLTTTHLWAGDTLPVGSVLTRSKDWLDDELSVKFNYTKLDGFEDYHFFVCDEVELVKE